MEEISLKEWKETIKSLANNKASGPSNISNEMLKGLGPVASNALLIIANIGIKIGDIPDQ